MCCFSQIPVNHEMHLVKYPGVSHIEIYIAEIKVFAALI